MQHLGRPRPSNEPHATPWAALVVSLGVLLAGLVAVPGCLNPRPEEDPSALDAADPRGDGAVGNDDGAADPLDAERETCDDNPALSGCEPPSASPGAGSVDEPPPAQAESPADVADAGAPSENDAGGVDAGAAGSQPPSVGE